MDRDRLRQFEWFNDAYCFWCYYPKDIDLESAFRQFLNGLGEDVFDGEWDVDRHVQTFSDRGTFALSIKSLPWDFAEHSDHWIKQRIIGLHTSGHPNELPDLRPHLSREGANSIMMLFRDSRVGAPVWLEHSIDYVRLIELFSKAFKPIYGCGTEYGEPLWWRRTGIERPETKIWPVNVLDLKHRNPDFHSRLTAFVERHPDRWSLKELTDAVVLLNVNTPIIAVDTNRVAVSTKVWENATHELLGESSGMNSTESKG